MHDGPYIGQVVARLSDGSELRELTPEEQAHSGRTKLYWIVGHSHWNPLPFFGEYAVELEHQAALHREVAIKLADLKRD